MSGTPSKRTNERLAPLGGTHPRPDLATPYTAPRTEAEKAVVAIWQEVLGVDRIGVDDDFFALGGHSLLATRLMARVRQLFSVDVPLLRLFETRTVASLAASIAETRGRDRSPEGEEDEAVTIVPDPDHRFDPFPLTEVQQAYWAGRSGDFELGNVATHVYLELKCASLDLERLTGAWRRLIGRHDMLRAIVRPDGRQQVLPEVPPAPALGDVRPSSRPTGFNVEVTSKS